MLNPTPRFEHARETETKKYFQQIDERQIERALRTLAENIGIDFSTVPIVIAGPDHPLFLLTELRLKIKKKSGAKPDVEQTLKSETKNFFAKKDMTAIERLKKLASVEKVEIDGTFPGLVYTIMGRIIMYPQIREDRATDMANAYSQRERAGLSFANQAEAEEYLKQLAEKYFFHEIGHIIYHSLTEDVSEKWQALVAKEETVRQRVKEVQLGNIHEQLNDWQIASEAFADTFCEVGSKGAMSNRLGDFPDLNKELKKILKDIGFPQKD